jgi:outer membrane protein OmpA-like peptidoglycan-associated protein
MRRLLGFTLLLLSTVSEAQPVEDPGMAEPRPSPAPGPSAHATTLMPAPAPPPPPEVSETVDVKTEWLPPDPKETRRVEGDLYDRVAAPTLTGGVGLFRTLTGDAGRAGTFRIGLHAGVFQQSELVVAGTATAPGDTDTHFAGDVTISYTPWKYLEAYLGIFNSSNKNERNDSGRSDPQVILALGDVQLGLKGRYPVTPAFDLALHVGVRFLNSVGGTFDGSATNAAFDLIGSLDLRHLARTARVPLRFHLNFGYLLDNSMSLLPSGQCMSSTSNDPCIRSRAVETFAWGVGSSRLRLALAVDAPTLIRNVVGLQPFVEYHVEVPVGDGDATVVNALRNDSSVKGDRLSGQSLQYLTLGVRVRPVAGLVLDTGLDVGLQSPGFQYGPPVPAWNLIFGAAYAYDPGAGPGKTKVVTRTITREIARGPVEGRVRGMVRDAKTHKPIANAAVRYLNRPRLTANLAGDDGTFASTGMVPGPVQLEITREDYEPLRVDAMVVAHAEPPVAVLLTPKPPAAGQVRVRVSEPSGVPVGMATVRLIAAGGAVVEADVESAGLFTAKLPAAEYALEVTANGFLGKERQLPVAPGQVQSVEVVLTRKPAVSHVTLTPTEIAIKGTIHFGTNNAEIKPDGEQLLDEVVDVLVRNPQLKKLRVEGHTDNRGGDEQNLKLSKARAAAVVAYLIKQGIEGARLESEGYGASQPLLPNLSAANRARNRRVTFRILDGGAAP